MTGGSPHIGRRIQAARKDAGFRSAELLAVYLGVGVRTVQRWESLPDARFSTVEKVAEATGKPISYFIEPDEAAVA